MWEMEVKTILFIAQVYFCFIGIFEIEIFYALFGRI